MASESPIQSGSFAKDALGCRLDALQESWGLPAAGLIFHRKAAASPPGQVKADGDGSGYLIGLSLAARHRRRIFSEHHSSMHDFSAGSIYIRDLRDDYCADLTGSFDFMLVEIPRLLFGEITEQGRRTGTVELSRFVAKPDPLLNGLLRAVLAKRSDASSNTLFFEQMAAAVSAHLIRIYGNRPGSFEGRRLRLSHRQEQLAKSFLANSAPEEASILKAATLCDMPADAFISAFRETTGQSPHAWVRNVRGRTL